MRAARTRSVHSVLSAAVVLAWCATAGAHELRPAYLELRETSPGRFSVLWKVPRVGDSTLSLHPRLPGAATATEPGRVVEGALVRGWSLEAGELRGRTVEIDGLDHTMTDALVRIEFADGSALTRRLDARQPSLVVPARETAWGVAATYLRLGIEHILSGFDHLLFVLSLVLLTGWSWSLLRTITAFTLAHSITLAAAALSIVNVPQQPVEAVIALSIAFVAAEALRKGGASPSGSSIGTSASPIGTSASPWLLAFAFGLLHGLGFAGALTGLGLPQAHVPLALFLFNVGVEIGQLAFLAALFSLAVLGRRLWSSQTERGRVVLAYAIGSLAMFWVVERVAVL